MNDDDDDVRQDSEPGIYAAISAMVKHINAHEAPERELAAAMVFIFSMLKMDPDDINEAVCEAYGRFEKDVVEPRRDKADAMLEEIQRLQRRQGRTGGRSSP